MAETEAQFIPTHIKEPHVFYNRRRGLMMLGRMDARLYLFVHDPALDQWKLLRLATGEDVRAVEGATRT